MTIHKNLLLTSTIVAGLAVTSQANALELKPYVGLEYQYIDVNLEGLSKDAFASSYVSIVPNIGLNFNDNFGIELGYTRSNSKSKSFKVGTTSIKSKAKFSGYHIDAIGYLPVHKQIDLVGQVGVGRYEFDVSLDTHLASLSDSAKETIFRYGVGVKYDINDNVSARLMARRLAISSPGLDDANTVSFGLAYNF